MIKVFLAEDEIVMREGIKNTIEWEKEGFEFVGEASDGELALPLIQKTKPDILITDIKMPFMDGLELSRYVKKELPDIKIIILSGYNDFEYAKAAIQIGVAEYLIKPITGVQLLEAIKGVAELVRQERQHKISLQKYEKDLVERERIEKMKFFKKLVSGKHTVSELLRDGQEMGIDLVAQQYNIVLFQIFAKGNPERYSEEKNEVEKLLKRTAQENKELVLVEGEMDNWIFLLKAVGEKDLATVEMEVAEYLRNMLKDFPNIEYFGGVGEPVERLSELNRCFEEANYSFACRYLEPHDQIVHGKRVQWIRAAKEQELKLSTIRADKLDRRAVENFLKTGLKSEVSAFVEEYFSSIGENNLKSGVFRQYIALDMCFAATGMVEQLGYEAKDLMERCGNGNVAATSIAGIQETKELLKGLFEEAVEMREVVARKKYRLLLQDAKNYIQQNFSNEDVSLNTVAASINLSPNHFSSIFRQETGQTFVEYLTSVRMEKARELLRGTTMKTAEIAQAVGYKDSHYFSYLFKKTQECTPREFRNKE